MIYFKCIKMNHDKEKNKILNKKASIKNGN